LPIYPPSLHDALPISFGLGVAGGADDERLAVHRAQALDGKGGIVKTEIDQGDDLRTVITGGDVVIDLSGHFEVGETGRAREEGRSEEHTSELQSLTNI